MIQLEQLTKVKNRGLSLGDVVVNEDGVLELRSLSSSSQPLSNAQFRLADMRFQLNLTPAPTHDLPDGNAIACEIWGYVGLMPFSAHGRERRSAVLEVLRSTRTMATQFAVTKRQEVIVIHQATLAMPVMPEDVFMEIIAMVQHMQPFLPLLRPLLLPTQH